MARLVDNLATYLVSQGICGAKGTGIFIGDLPEKQNNAVKIEQTGGVEPDKYLKVEQPTVQVMVRNTSYPNGLDKIKEIYDALHQQGDDLVLEAGGVDVMTVFALQEPTHIGKDANNRHLFVVNFVFKLRGND